ncbi:alpha/beta hydrolase family protein [Speluncibacter jeojiensis]|uniref:alpha/beta hydrolase family protein n=1 Tax=Speluncibacter jeojiensis TaxID=2710754 RepID=UPI00240FF07E|nr:alpha/beta family hydrolase [Rhodococcus sp. D2-41]
MDDANPMGADTEPITTADVHGFVHRPAGPAIAGLALTHGAGGNCEAPLLRKVASTFCAAGVLVVRFDLPFRVRRASGPPQPSRAGEDRAGIVAAAALTRRWAPGPLLLAGHSYGGRQISMAAAEDPALADGLMLLSYPLHPPGKPDRLRTEHLPDLRTPTVFVHGTRDPFGTPEELGRALAAVPAPTRLVTIDGAGHDLRGRSVTGAAATAEAALAGAIGLFGPGPAERS